MRIDQSSISLKERFLGSFAFVINLLNRGQERSVKAKKNILASFFIKGASISISLILVPIALHYIDDSTYGIWLTLSSIVGWFSFFDIGLSQGLRNKFAEAKAKGEDDLARIYVSTTYAILTIVFSLVWVGFIIANNFLNWAHILNAPEAMAGEVSLLAIVVFTYFCLQFVLKIIGTLILANQQPALSSLLDVLSQVVALVFVLILVKTTEGSLVKLGFAFCLAPILVLTFANLILFRGAYKNYKPKFSKIKFKYAKGLFNLGIIFFIIQIAAIVQFQTANIIIARYFGTADVTSFNIVYKYFGILNMVFIIFLTPFWSASTEAYLKNDIQWIKKAIRNYNKLNLLLFLVGCVMLLFSEKIYNLWLGEGTVKMTFSLSLWGFLFFILSMFGNTYVFLLNGISALRIQFYTSILSPLIYVFVAIFLIGYYHMGVYALFIASIISDFNGFLLAPIQYYQVIVRKKKGMWIK